MGTRRELTAAVAERYKGSNRAEKARILDEFVVVTGFHRKHAVRLLRGDIGPPPVRRVRRRVYDEAERNALVLLWEASDRFCGKRLKALLPEQTRLAAKRKRNLREFVETLVRLETDPTRYRDRQGAAEWADRFADETSIFAYRKRIGDTGITWTWRALTRRFLDYQLPKLKATYRKPYERYLTLKEFASVNDELVSDLRLGQLERVRDDINRNYAPSAVHRALSQAKEMLSWAWKYHAAASGLDEVQTQWWERWSFEYKTRRRTHMPTIDEIARTLVIAETFRHLADGEHDTYPGTLGGLWGVALTAQRTGSFLQMRPDRLFDAGEIDRKLHAWKIANWTAEE
jgi:hypothetical protein